MTDQVITGIVQKVEYTLNGRGNQWTTIGDVRYCTFFDWNESDWRIGDMVTCTVRVLKDPRYDPCLVAGDIKKVNDDHIDIDSTMFCENPTS